MTKCKVRKKREVAKNTAQKANSANTKTLTMLPAAVPMLATFKPGAPIDLARVREEIQALVADSATAIAAKAVAVAIETGQLTSAKYLFEAIGLYQGEETAGNSDETSLSYELLKRLGLPTEPDNDGTNSATAMPSREAQGNGRCVAGEKSDQPAVSKGPV